MTFTTTCTRASNAGAAKSGRKRRLHPAGRSGSVMLEFVIAFPLVLVLTFACIQFAQLWVARMVVHYGAYCAARSALVCEESEYNNYNGAPARAATEVCGLLQTWGLFTDAGAADRMRYTTVSKDGEWNVTATHDYTFSLVMPIVGQIMAWQMNPWADSSSAWTTHVNGHIDSLGYPTVDLTESVTLPKPYKTMVPAGF